ncbi:MAG: DUF4012 domain-containing protein [bacterium]
MSNTALKTIKKVPHFKTVLITGAASYLGASLAENLLKLGYRVVGLDTLSPANPGYLKLFAGNPRFHFFSADISRGLPGNIVSLDYIFHLESAKPPLENKAKNSLNQFVGDIEGAKHLLNFALNTKAALLVAVPIGDQTVPEILTHEYYRKTNLNARLARLPYYYGQHFQKEKPQHLLAQFIKTAKKGEALKVRGTGLSKEYYTHIDDLTAGLAKAMFTPHTAGKTFTLCRSGGTTNLELAYIVKGAGLMPLEVEFLPDDKETYHEYPAINTENLEQLNWEPQIDLKEGIKPLLWQKPKPLSPAVTPILNSRISFNIEPPHFKKPSLSLPQLNLPSFKLKLPRRAFLLTLPILLPLLYLGTSLALGGWNLKGAIQSCKEAEFSKCSEQAFTAGRHFERVASFTAKLNLLPPNMKHLLSAGQYGAETIYYEAKGLEIVKQSLKAAAPYSPENPPLESELIMAAANFSKGLERFMLFCSEAKFIDHLEYFQNNQDRILGQLTTLSRLVKEMPELLGFMAPKNYLVLLQNNLELRAGGGFVGSYALITFNKGKISDFRTDDIYNLDGILEEKEAGLTAPAEFVKYLGVTQVFLRDANFSPNFPENAQRMLELYREAGGVELAGVVAVNLSATRELLEKLGPLETQKYGLIDSGNVLEKAIFFAEKNYFEGAQNKKSFMSALAGGLIEKILSNPNEQLLKMAPLIYESLNQKDIQVFLLNSNLEQTLAQAGWDGKTSIEPKSDYLMLVEANLGANKANYTLKRHIKYEVEETDRQGSLQATLTIGYLNTADTAVWPLGDYKVFATVLKNGSTQTFYKTIKSQENYVKTLSWDLSPEINASNYKLRVQKQSGMEDTTFSFFYTPALGGRPYSFEGYLTKDIEFDINNEAYGTKHRFTHN